MAITIEGIKISGINIKREEKDGVLDVTGSYELVSNTGVTLAKQSFNDYGGMKVQFSPVTVKLLRDAMSAIGDDLNMVLGLS